MRKVYLENHQIVSPLGSTSQENIEAVTQGKSAMQSYHSPFMGDYVAGKISEIKLQERFKRLENAEAYTKLEKMMILAVAEVLQAHQEIPKEKIVFIIATTKGNVDALAEENPFSKERAKLPQLAKRLQHYFKLPETPIVVSNACISGGLAVSVAKKLIQNKTYDHAVVVGGDLVSEFTLTGFNSFQALAKGVCEPFSKDRTGINIGEAAAAVWVTSVKPKEEAIEIIGEATANDANHISGPSRTGEGLYLSVQKALQEAGILASEIDYISAHGTATLFNDEMESIAFHRLGLQHTPLNSLKAYYGHTLGASALLELIFSQVSLQENRVFKSLGYKNQGTSKALNMITTTEHKSLQIALKTASGFGGCNFAMLLKKETE
ncbi:beta-ketoacyl synthase N-terminal-like domain-containing protein [Mesonia sp. MT50]|uniref:Beta-ketoacyl synthase N-terminal-like domain-containing protein n=1 Tax=Mesonia profundi TaxID=3070998 RepID=A0ABU1A118_9FLAO|nr:beta-ketoacyl synthase N-terminal-like domain-containing protein [Mesonia profundi]MDQ7917309.1 beta-ketoacyl synthase N-terminal-like domain-containing protein [Mesonia profundi]